MLTLVLNGSPSRVGNSMRLASAVLASLGGEHTVADLYDLALGPCRDCGACAAGEECALADDMAALLPQLARADVILVASPLHFTSLSAPIIAFFSRLQWLWQTTKRSEKPFDGTIRPGGLVVTAGADYPNMFEPARAVTAAAFNTMSLRLAGMATARGTDTLPADHNPAALAEAAALGRRLAEMAGRKENKKLPRHTARE